MRTAASLYVLQSGLTGPAGAAYPTHLATWTSAADSYTLDGGNELRVPLTWSEARRQRHQDLRVPPRQLPRRRRTTPCTTAAPRPGLRAPYAQILRDDPPTKRSYFNTSSYAFHGPALYDGTKYRKLEITDAQDSHLALDVT